MLNVFVKKSAEEMHIQLSDGRMIPLEDLVRDYERLLKETSKPKEEASKRNVETSKPKETASKQKVKTSKPKEEASKRNVETSKLKETASKQKVKTSKPKEAASKPKVETSKPKETASKPKVETSKPKEEASKSNVETSKPKGSKSTVSKLKVGEWFLIDREIINQNKEEIRRKCNKLGYNGEMLWKRLNRSNKIADENPDQYPRLIETYIFKKDWEYKTCQEMRDMCKDIGDGMCDEIICDLELQMRICNGELVDDLLNKRDKLPNTRMIKVKWGYGVWCGDNYVVSFPNSAGGAFGGDASEPNGHSPARLLVFEFDPKMLEWYYTPYAFRRVVSQH